MAKKILRKVLTILFANGSTISLGLLTVVGAMAFSASLWICIPSFLLAVAFEGQMNNEGVNNALRRILDANFTRRQILRQYLEEKIQSDTDNLILNDYRKLFFYLDELKKRIHSTEQHQAIHDTEKQLKNIENFLLKRLMNKTSDDNESSLNVAADSLLQNDRKKLLLEMRNKIYLSRVSWIFVAGGGAASGLATLSAIKAGIVVFGFLSLVPGGIFIGLSAVAAVGYSLLLYENVCSMIAEYKKSSQGLFTQKENESSLKYGLRCAFVLLGIGLAIFATVATAGTWWSAAKHGAELLNSNAKIASVIRTISISLMALPTAIFGVKNSLESIDKMGRSDFKGLLVSMGDELKNTWNKEAEKFLNPFWYVEKLITATAKASLFVGHLVTGGFVADRLERVPAAVSTSAIALSEGLTHANFLPDERDAHDHDSLWLKGLFGIVCIPVTTLKILAVAWDFIFVTQNVASSWKKMFSTKTNPVMDTVLPTKPESSSAWGSAKISKKLNDPNNPLLTTNVNSALPTNTDYYPRPFKPIAQCKERLLPADNQAHGFVHARNFGESPHRAR
jgi:hypothetical protein